jgi:DNA modification methylase
MTAIVVRGDAGRLPLPDGSVDLIVTSPPYWALRSYTDGGEHYAEQVGSEPTPGGENVAELSLCVLCGRPCRYAREYCSACRRAVTGDNLEAFG